MTGRHPRYQCPPGAASAAAGQSGPAAPASADCLQSTDRPPMGAFAVNNAICPDPVTWYSSRGLAIVPGCSQLLVSCRRGAAGQAGAPAAVSGDCRNNRGRLRSRPAVRQRFGGFGSAEPAVNGHDLEHERPGWAGRRPRCRVTGPVRTRAELGAASMRQAIAAAGGRYDLSGPARVIGVDGSGDIGGAKPVKPRKPGRKEGRPLLPR